MKKSFLFLLPFLLIYFNPSKVFSISDPSEEKALIPEGFNYQAIARDVSGMPIANKESPITLSEISKYSAILTAPSTRYREPISKAIMQKIIFKIIKKVGSLILFLLISFFSNFALSKKE